MELERIEKEINTESFEAFYHIGQKLLDVKKHHRYEEAGFKSWTAYCSSGRIEYAKVTADRYIRSSELRPKLDVGPNGIQFTVRHMIELCKCSTDIQIRVLLKSAMSPNSVKLSKPQRNTRPTSQFRFTTSRVS